MDPSASHKYSIGLQPGDCGSPSSRVKFPCSHPSQEIIFSRGYGFHERPATLSTFETWSQWGYLSRVGVFCPTLPEELFPVFGEFVEVVGGQQLVFLERPKRALLDSCQENTLVIPFVRFLPRKGNPPQG
ncbi:hypothetical protein TNCV_1019051 [Trichonephila clavipes]|nr:hypothetical protein TNCV_1019051 [Trichonephila clavipes]